MKFIGDAKLARIDGLILHPTFRTLFAYSARRENELREEIVANGFSKASPVLVGVFGSDKYLVDGHQRRGAALAAGLTEIWVQEIEFDGLEEAVQYNLTCHRLRRKGGDADLLFELCVRSEQLEGHGGNRRGESEDEIKSQKVNLITGESTGAKLKRITHGDIAKLYGIKKYRVDRVRSKYFQALKPEAIKKIREGDPALDVYEFVEHWETEQFGEHVKDDQIELRKAAEQKRLSKQIVNLERTSDQLFFLSLLPLPVGYSNEVAQMAQAEGIPVLNLIARWIEERIQGASNSVPKANHEIEDDVNVPPLVNDLTPNSKTD
jgi:hypothetical protein